MLLGNVMTKEVIVMLPDESVSSASKLMRNEGVGSVVIVDRWRRPIGIITDRDIVVRVVAEGLDPDKISVGEVMTPDVISGKRADRIFDAVRKMAENGIRRLPIVDSENRIVGIISIDDLMAILITEMSNLAVVIAGPSKLL
jgi:CBS domain-containing protein